MGWGASSSEKGREECTLVLKLNFPGQGERGHVDQRLFSISCRSDFLSCKLDFLPWHLFDEQRDVKNSGRALTTAQGCIILPETQGAESKPHSHFGLGQWIPGQLADLLNGQKCWQPPYARHHNSSHSNYLRQFTENHMLEAVQSSLWDEEDTVQEA